jgi:hypothetical protein
MQKILKETFVVGKIKIVKKMFMNDMHQFLISLLFISLNSLKLIATNQYKITKK